MSDKFMWGGVNKPLRYLSPGCAPSRPTPVKRWMIWSHAWRMNVVGTDETDTEYEGPFVRASDYNALALALGKCIETFDDMQRVLRLLNRPVLADACAVAADSSRDVLATSDPT